MGVRQAAVVAKGHRMKDWRPVSGRAAAVLPCQMQCRHAHTTTYLPPPSPHTHVSSLSLSLLWPLCSLFFLVLSLSSVPSALPTAKLSEAATLAMMHPPAGPCGRVAADRGTWGRGQLVGGGLAGYSAPLLPASPRPFPASQPPFAGPQRFRERPAATTIDGGRACRGFQIHPL